MKANERGGWGVRAVTRPVNQLPPTNLGHTPGCSVKARAKSPGLSSESPLEAGCLGRFQRPFSAQPGALSSRPSCWRLCQCERSHLFDERPLPEAG
ncbi:MAG: hypothetical protein DRI61_08335 [Chloroflexi bacterium]|nr:MAG: hypothetical protein DRI61_08335 [Chloroflexota bacterium]